MSSTRLDNTTLRTGREAPRQPPRLTGDYDTDYSATMEWMRQLHASLRDSGLGDPGYQFAKVEIDQANPPDPTGTTLARAQATANLALSLLIQAQDVIETQAAAIADLTSRVAVLEAAP